MSLLAKFLAALAIGILKYLQQREDLKASLRAELEKESMNYALKAAEWKARAAGNPTADRLRVQRPGSSLSLQDRDADDDGLSHLP